MLAAKYPLMEAAVFSPVTGEMVSPFITIGIP